MALTPGTKLGAYEIQCHVGSGGMGEVYRARDVRLDRIVAIKVLSAAIASTPEMRIRFEREARAISALNHPNICHLYDIGCENGTQFLVMEYLDGESLAERLRKGALPFEQLLKTAIEIADALDRAHQGSIIHRDLKPGNIMMTKSGAKLLDFGLAKPATAAAPLNIGPTQSGPVPPISSAGTIVGTIHYMAPEQLEGKEADARSDIFALGAVMYEASTGHRAFDGKSPMSVAASVLQSDPLPLTSVQSGLPPALDYVVRACLAKNPAERFQSAHDLKLQLSCLSQSSHVARVTGQPSESKKVRTKSLAVAFAAVLVVLLALALTKFFFGFSRPPAFGVTRFSITLPKGQELATDTTQALVLAPDGRRLAYIAAEAGVPHLYVRRFDSFDAVEIPDSEGAVFPFFSPKGDWIAFFSQGKLEKAPADGGNPVPICDLPTFFGGTWTGKDTIVTAVPGFGLATVPSNGGALQKVSFSISDRVYPEGPIWLGKDDWIAFTDYLGSARRVFAGNLSSGKMRLILNNAQAASYSADHLVYYSGGAIWAVPFDIEKLAVIGTARQLASGVNEENYIAQQSSASDNGVLAYAPGEANNFSRNMYFVDRQGSEQKIDLPADDYVDPAISPDGRYIAICIRSAGSTGQQLALYDREHKVLTRLISNGAMNEAPVWMPDREHLLFNFLGPSAKQGIYVIPVDGSAAPQLLTESTVTTHVTAAAGDYAVVMLSDPVTSTDLLLFNLHNHEMHPFRRTPATERQGTLAPDGHWIAYASNESGRSEIYVEPVPGPGGRWRISESGGEQPRWVRNGREIIYRNGTRLMSVPVTTTPIFRAQRPLQLFDRKFDLGGSVGGYDVTPDGRAFVMTRSAHQSPTEIRVIVGWTVETKSE